MRFWARAPPHRPGRPTIPASRTSSMAAAIPFYLCRSNRSRRATTRCRQHQVFRQRRAQPQSGLVTGWPVDLLRARAGAAEEMNVWRVRPSGGTPEQLTALRAAVNRLAPIDQRTLLYVARAEDGSGPWLWSLDVETKVTRRVTSASSTTRRCRRVVTAARGRHRGESHGHPVAWPLLDRLAEDRDVQPYPLPSARAFSPRFGRKSLFYLVRSGSGRRPVGFQEGQHPKSAEDRRRFVVRAACRVARWKSRGHHRQARGKPRLSMMSADGTNARTLAPSIEIREARAAPTGRRTATGSWQPERCAGIRAFQDPGGWGRAVRLVPRSLVNPVWSPDGTPESRVWRPRRGRPGSASSA